MGTHDDKFYSTPAKKDEISYKKIVLGFEIYIFFCVDL